MGLDDEELQRYQRYYNTINSGKLSDDTVRRLLASNIGWEPLMIDKETAKRLAVWALLSLGVVLGVYVVWFALQGGG